MEENFSSSDLPGPETFWRWNEKGRRAKKHKNRDGTDPFPKAKVPKHRVTKRVPDWV